MKVGFIYEHPSWSDSLIAAFNEAGVDLVPVNVGELSFAASGDDIPFALAVNRVNVMPSADRPPHVVFHTLHYLAFLEARGVRIVNGARAHQAGASKAVQNGIFQHLGLHYPEAVAVYRPLGCAGCGGTDRLPADGQAQHRRLRRGHPSL